MAGKPGCGGAPLGNKRALGNNGGRPRTYDRDFIHEQLEIWSKKPNSVVLTQFCDEFSIPSTTVQDFAREYPEFRITLRLVRDRLAARRELYHNNGTITQTSYNRYVKHYDGFLKVDEREEMEYEEKLKAEAINKDISPNDQAIENTLRYAKLEAENAVIKELLQKQGNLHEPKTGTIDLPSEQTP